MSSLPFLGGAWPSPAYLFGSLLFSLIGFVVFRVARHNEQPRALVIGVALMVYPYFVSGAGWLYAVGAGLCALLYLLRD